MSSQASRVWITIGLPGFGGDLQLPREDRALHVARREIVMVIEADFADGQHLRMRGQLAQPREGFGRGLGGIVRMHADGGVDERIALGQPDGGFQVGRAVAGADGHHALHAGGAGALDHLLAVGVELGVVQVAVGIDQPHFRRAPTGMSSWKPASTGLPPSTDAATIMPLDSMPFSLRGCRLATITTLRFTRSAGV